MLADELGLDPGVELQELEAAILAQDPALAPVPAHVVPSAAPPRLGGSLSRFVGATAEIAELSALVDDHRLVTVVGPGARARPGCRSRWPPADRTANRSGSWSSPRSPTPGCAGCRRQRRRRDRRDRRRQRGDDAPTDRLARFIGTHSCSLLLDNCEHVIDEAARVAEALLVACPELRILATSREPLAIGGERCGRSRRWRSTTRSSSSPTARRRRARFRARRRRPKPSSARSATASTACRSRSSSPPRASARSPSAQLARPARRSLPAPDRRRPHRAPPPADAARRRRLELRPALRRRATGVRTPLGLRRRLSLEAAEAVCADDDVGRDDVADLLAHLVDKSLVTRPQTSGEARYRPLADAAHYGREQLAARGESRRPRRATRAHFGELCHAGRGPRSTAEGTRWRGCTEVQARSRATCVPRSAGSIDGRRCADTRWRCWAGSAGPGGSRVTVSKGWQWFTRRAGAAP